MQQPMCSCVPFEQQQQGAAISFRQIGFTWCKIGCRQDTRVISSAGCRAAQTLELLDRKVRNAAGCIKCRPVEDDACTRCGQVLQLPPERQQVGLVPYCLVAGRRVVSPLPVKRSARSVLPGAPSEVVSAPVSESSLDAEVLSRRSSSSAICPKAPQAAFIATQLKATFVQDAGMRCSSRQNDSKRSSCQIGWPGRWKAWRLKINALEVMLPRRR